MSLTFKLDISASKSSSGEAKAVALFSFSFCVVASDCCIVANRESELLANRKEVSCTEIVWVGWRREKNMERKRNIIFKG